MPEPGGFPNPPALGFARLSLASPTRTDGNPGRVPPRSGALASPTRCRAVHCCLFNSSARAPRRWPKRLRFRPDARDLCRARPAARFSMNCGLASFLARNSRSLASVARSFSSLARSAPSRPWPRHEQHLDVAGHRRHHPALGRVTRYGEPPARPARLLGHDVAVAVENGLLVVVADVEDHLGPPTTARCSQCAASERR
jgi:hypothetical protein